MYLYAIEYFDGDSSGSQWDTVYEDCLPNAVKAFKTNHAQAKIYDIFVRHHKAFEYIEDEEV